MRIGTVLGPIWATKKCPALAGQIFLRVATESGEIIAADRVGAGVGERVILVSGGAARLERRDVPVDAAIIAILDETEARHERR